MDNDGYPTQETLIELETWDWQKAHFFDLAEYVVGIWHFGDPWATLSDWRTDEFGQRYKELRLATGGWSGNEDIISALQGNMMFMMMCWYYSQRGGLFVYHIKEVKR